MADEAVDNRPNDQKELENWYKDQAAVLDGKAPEDRSPGVERDMTVEGNDTSAYVGVDPMYQNYASDTEKPLAAEPDPANPTPYVAEQVAASGGLSDNDGAKVTGEDGSEVEDVTPAEGEDAETSDAGGDEPPPPPPGPEGVAGGGKSSAKS